MPEKIMLPLREAAGRSGMSYEWLRKQCIAGQLPHVRVGSGKCKKYLVNYEALLKRLETEGTEGRK